MSAPSVDQPAVTDQRARQRGQQCAVGGFETRTRDLATQDRELVSQHEDLGILGPIPAAAQHQEVEHEPDETIETGHG
jgi:hypothetical protein